jgi:hypothetical protein
VLLLQTLWHASALPNNFVRLLRGKYKAKSDIQWHVQKFWILLKILFEFSHLLWTLGPIFDAFSPKNW